MGSKYQEDSEDPIYFRFNVTEHRELYDVLGTGKLSPEVNYDGPKTTNILQGDWTACKNGDAIWDRNPDYEARYGSNAYLYLCVASDNRAHKDSQITVKSVGCRNHCPTGFDLADVEDAKRYWSVNNDWAEFDKDT